MGTYGEDYPFLVAPLRTLRAMEHIDGLPGNIQRGRVRFAFPLPHEAAVRDALGEPHFADLRLIQPLRVRDLIEAGPPIACLGTELKKALQGLLLVFFTNRKPTAP